MRNTTLITWEKITKSSSKNQEKKDHFDWLIYSRKKIRNLKQNKTNRQSDKQTNPSSSNGFVIRNNFKPKNKKNKNDKKMAINMKMNKFVFYLFTAVNDNGHITIIIPKLIVIELSWSSSSTLSTVSRVYSHHHHHHHILTFGYICWINHNCWWF